jgi:hypothetical protein
MSARAGRIAMIALLAMGTLALPALAAKKKKRVVNPATTTTAPTPAPTPTPTPTPAPTRSSAPTVDLTLPAAAVPAPMMGTRCAACHQTSNWLDVRFDHDRTGFPLVGEHRRVQCKGCHPSNFKDRVPNTCAGCHRDPHGAEFGMQCAGCHDEHSWQTTFTADAHRRTNFPLSGRHAMIPCSECHPNARDRSFARTPVTCSTCHLADYQRTGLTTIDHVAANFSLDCRQCHSTLMFRPARFPDHDRCFLLSGGPHAGIRCTNCHISRPPAIVTGQCSTNTASCTSCHEHSCDRTAGKHNGVLGYECRDRKCYECHKFAR